MLNSDEISEAGGDVRRARIGKNDRVVRVVVRKKIMGDMKGGKEAGMDGIVVEMLKKWKY